VSVSSHFSSDSFCCFFGSKCSMPQRVNVSSKIENVMEIEGAKFFVESESTLPCLI
jgi:hypothetical protein